MMLRMDLSTGASKSVMRYGRGNGPIPRERELAIYIGASDGVAAEAARSAINSIATTMNQAEGFTAGIAVAGTVDDRVSTMP